jgi:deoxyhypusine monooxygenase
MGDKPEVSEYGSVDPAPASDDHDFENMKSILLDDSARMFERMRVVFKFRNIRNVKSCLALCDAFTSKSALLRHELAYVLGQMQMNEAIPTLIDRLSDIDEHVMVRHEAAEALGAIGNLSAKPVLEAYLSDSFIEVSESCEVALDLLDWVVKSSVSED